MKKPKNTEQTFATKSKYRKKSVIVDYHVHTPYCGHAKGKMIEYVETAVNCGLSEIGFSDHLGRYYLGRVQKKKYWDWGMPEKDLARYFDEASELKKLFSDRIIIRIGLEVDYIEGAEHLVERIVNNFPFDYLLGSIHCLPAQGWHHLLEYGKTDSPDAIYSQYFSAVKAALQSGLFQSLAHLDFLWRYVKWPVERWPELAGFISEAVSAAASSDICMEINANGYAYSQAEYTKDFNPYDLFLDSIKKYGPTITLGSDAHSPRHVAKFFSEIIALLKNKGITNVSLFDRKKRTQAQLS
ncbi:MAG TPA: hypothetical protein DCO75_02585 [Fibrobacteres bacterium]|nr:hypothetical protein [Fibrobacterota bacterium]